MRRLPIAAFVTLPWLAACAPPDFPDDRASADSGALAIPAIDPIGDILSATPPAGDDTVAADLQDRGDRLRTRADALRSVTP